MHTLKLFYALGFSLFLLFFQNSLALSCDAFLREHIIEGAPIYEQDRRQLGKEREEKEDEACALQSFGIVPVMISAKILCNQIKNTRTCSKRLRKYAYNKLVVSSTYQVRGEENQEKTCSWYIEGNYIGEHIPRGKGHGYVRPCKKMNDRFGNFISIIF